MLHRLHTPAWQFRFLVQILGSCRAYISLVQRGEHPQAMTVVLQPSGATCRAVGPILPRSSRTSKATCVRSNAKDREGGQARPGLDRIKDNPAYQRLLQGSWREQYGSSGTPLCVLFVGYRLSLEAVCDSEKPLVSILRPQPCTWPWPATSLHHSLPVQVQLNSRTCHPPQRASPAQNLRPSPHQFSSTRPSSRQCQDRKQVTLPQYPAVRTAKGRAAFPAAAPAASASAVPTACMAVPSAEQGWRNP